MYIGVTIYRVHKGFTLMHSFSTKSIILYVRIHTGNNAFSFLDLPLETFTRRNTHQIENKMLDFASFPKSPGLHIYIFPIITLL